MSRNSFLRYSLLSDDSDDEDGNITRIGTISSIFDCALNSSLSYGVILVGEVSDFKTEVHVTFALSDFQDDAYYLQKGHEVQFQLVSVPANIPYLSSSTCLSSGPCLVAKSVYLTGKMKSMFRSNISYTQNATKDEICNIASSPVDTVIADEEHEPEDYNQYRPLSGAHANVNWRAVSMDTLRLHPLYKPLPEPNVVSINTAQDLSMFRQDSWQWNVLHQGRLTTSRAAACLGFYEEQGSKVLGIPKSLIGHERVLDAWNELLTDPITDWSVFSDKLRNDINVLETSPVETSHHPSSATKSSASSFSPEIWQLNKNFKYVSSTPLLPTVSSSSANLVNPPNLGFHYSYLPKRYSQPQQRRSVYTSAHSARLAWGSAQEATAILVALNYFDMVSNGTSLVLECGLLPLEALNKSEYAKYLISSRYPATSNETSPAATAAAESSMSSLPLLGASPDGIILHKDGSKEVLEVKCSSPFVNERFTSKSGSKNKNTKSSNSKSSNKINNNSASNTSTSKVKMYITDKSPPMSVPAWHIPQLQLEILCAGPQCTGAILVSLSALNGAVMYRIPRDDQYIIHMLRLFQAFRHHYVSQASTPPINFMTSTTEMKKLNYFYFYERTLHIARNAEIVTTIKQNEIQRNPYNKQFFV